MQLYKTFDENDLIRIEDDEGSSVTVHKRGDYALILSLFVPGSDRREGIGTALVEAACQALLSKGVHSLEVDYPDSLEGFGEFLKSTGFSEISSAPVLSVELKTILSKSVVKRIILSEVDGVNYVSLVDLNADQWEELFDSFTKKHLMIENSDVSRFFHDASGIVYDDHGNLQAFLLCSADEDEAVVHVDFLVGMGKGKPQYIMGVLRGMLIGLLEAGGERTFQTITLVAANPDINQILDRVFKDGESVSHAGNVVFASKQLEEIYDETEAEDALDPDLEDEWRREIRRVPLQTNIGLKMPWLRHMEDKPAASEEKYEEETKEDSEERNFVRELLFRKDEDETDGLEYTDTIRITTGNLDRFKDYLDEINAADLSRHFYRGLIALTDDSPCACLVYELKNYEEAEDTEAEITYFSVRDEEAGERLLSEFESEAGKARAKSIFFELPELSDLEKEVMEDIGFLIENREGQDLMLSLKELNAIPALSKKPKNYIKSIRTLPEKKLRLGINNCLFYNKKGALEDLGILPTDWFEQDISNCVLSDGKVTGLFLVHVRGDRSLSVDLLYAAGKEYQQDLLHMLRYGLAAALKKYPHETKVVVRRHNKEIRALTGKLFPGKSGRTVFAGERRVEQDGLFF